MKNRLGFIFIIIAFLMSACVTEPQREGKDLNDASDFNAQMGLQYMKQVS
jgi:Tfp pilus assembly protein PilF